MYFLNARPTVVRVDPSRNGYSRWYQIQVVRPKCRQNHISAVCALPSCFIASTGFSVGSVCIVLYIGGVECHRERLLLLVWVPTMSKRQPVVDVSRQSSVFGRDACRSFILGDETCTIPQSICTPRLCRSGTVPLNVRVKPLPIGRRILPFVEWIVSVRSMVVTRCVRPTFCGDPDRIDWVIVLIQDLP